MHQFKLRGKLWKEAVASEKWRNKLRYEFNLDLIYSLSAIHDMQQIFLTKNRSYNRFDFEIFLYSLPFLKLNVLNKNLI